MSRHAFVFNGDADGLCSLQQLHLSQPCDGQLFSGVKRDQSLLGRVEPDWVDRVTVLDLPLSYNREALIRLLDAGKTVTYVDHHFPGDIPSHANLDLRIDTDANWCTSLIVDRSLGGAAHRWAIVGAFGDNLRPVANQLAGQIGIDASKTRLLDELGRLLNYNSYGDSIEDLRYSPVELHKRMRDYSDPVTFIEDESVFSNLREAYNQDMSAARGVLGETRPGGLVYFLPNLPWARRLIGTFANLIANDYRNQAIAVLTYCDAHHYRVHLRTPAVSTVAAGDFCGRFPSGGGRASAGGINFLPQSDLDLFLNEFDQTFHSVR